MSEAQFVLVDWEATQAFLTAVFEKVGVPEEDAALVSRILVETSMQGTASHGVFWARSYVTRLHAKVMEAVTKVSVVRDLGATGLIDGGNGVGHVICAQAMDLAIDKARQYGVGLVGVRASNHFGAAYYYAKMALPHGAIGVCMTNTPPTLPPLGGRTPVLGTGPLAVAIPTGGDFPVVLDIATTMAAGAKVRLAAMRGQQIPLGWAVDGEGRPTTDPNAAQKGSGLWLGGVSAHKGYGLALVIETLTAVMTGASFGMRNERAGANPGARTEFDPTSGVWDIGQCLLAIMVEHFMPMDEFTARMDELIRQLKSSEPLPDTDGVFIAGEKEYRSYQKSLSEGLLLDTEIYADLEHMSQSYSVPLEIKI